jgi:hypothetical protein
LVTSCQPFSIFQKGKQYCPPITIMLALRCGIWQVGNSHQLIQILYFVRWRCPQVYVTVFADGPTRVLRFADVQDQGAEEAEQSILDLAARLRQVEEQLWRINASFSALHGASGAHA